MIFGQGKVEGTVEEQSVEISPSVRLKEIMWDDRRVWGNAGTLRSCG